MNRITMTDMVEYVNENIEVFHRSKIKSLEGIDLKTILKKKNPYLFKAKNIRLASDLIKDLLQAYLYSSEEKIFGNFLEDLAIFISGKTCSGTKSAATGIDLEFEKKGVHYLVSIKSGPNWGNSSQHRRQENDFKVAERVLKQSHHTPNVQSVLGICYGKTRTSFLRGYMKVVGQNFWYFISGVEELYTDIIEPLGHKAKQHNEQFLKKKDHVINSFTKQFLIDFCDGGQINWKRLVQFNSGNSDLTI